RRSVEGRTARAPWTRRSPDAGAGRPIGIIGGRNRVFHSPVRGIGTGPAHLSDCATTLARSQGDPTAPPLRQSADQVQAETGTDATCPPVAPAALPEPVERALRVGRVDARTAVADLDVDRPLVRPDQYFHNGLIRIGARRRLDAPVRTGVPDR